MGAEPWADRATGRSLAIAASVAAHLLVLLFLVWRLGATPRLAETPAMQVELSRLWPRAKPPPERRRDRRAAGVRAASASPSVERPIVPTPEAAPGPPALEGPAGDVRPMLRGLFGCEPAALAGLSAEERQRCRERLGADALRAQRQPGSRLNLDPTGRYAVDPMPYLGRLPHNGCKARAAGDVGPMGEQGPAAGVQCAWSF